MADQTTQNTQNQTDQKAPDEVQVWKEKVAALEKEKQEWLSKTKETPNEVTLNDKVRLERESTDKKTQESKLLESALTFNLTSTDFLKQNESVLPKDISDIFKAADREKYDSAIHKANATKAAIVQSFFSQQSNVDYLTDSQKNALADYQKLTKNGKEEKAKEIYENLFEPALSTLKRVKKAEELARANQGFGGNTDSDQAYKEKLQKMAEQKLFRGKN
jgi:hypothetical protein